MEMTITSAVIHETGYKTWHDFFGHILTYSRLNDQYYYGYHDPEGKERNIELGIDKTVLSYLAQTELLIFLKEAGFDSFDACWEHIVKQQQAGAPICRLTYIQVDKNKQVSLKEVSFPP